MGILLLSAPSILISLKRTSCVLNILKLKHKPGLLFLPVSPWAVKAHYYVCGVQLLLDYLSIVLPQQNGSKERSGYVGAWGIAI